MDIQGKNHIIIKKKVLSIYMYLHSSSTYPFFTKLVKTIAQAFLHTDFSPYIKINYIHVNTKLGKNTIFYITLVL